jgi:putative ABC transport system permease protein
MGPSGSGKSTLMHCMAGLDKPTSGQTFVSGMDIGTLDDAGLTRLRRDRIGFVFQSFNLVPVLTAGENITLPAALAGTKVDRDWLGYLTEQLGIADRLTHRPSELSGGQQQRVACARALINKPDLIFADEPTGNLDSNASAELLGFLRRSVTELGQSIVMVTHDPRGAAYADRVIFLADGAAVGELARPTADSVLERMRTLGPDVRTVTIKGLLAHKLRLALTALAIVLGVTLISGTFVLTDTLHNTFNVLFGNIYSKIDFQVRGVAQLGSGGNAVRNPIPESLLATVRGVPGVAAADGQVTGYAQFVAPDGKPIQIGGAPTLGVSFVTDQQISTLHLIAGGPPVTSDDVVMDAGTAQKYGFTVGQRVRILSALPPKTYTITGIAQFGSANNLAGATLAAFTLPTAQAVAQEVGKLDNINVVAAPGASKPEVQRAIARALPPGVEVVTGQTVVNESTSSVNQALSFFSTALLVFAPFSTALLVFAFISLFVGGFTIFNTFSIIVGQRTRELALLRIVGASRRQVFRSVLAEAAITGLVSSVIGLGLGVLAALGLQALLRGFGITLPPGSLVFEPRTAAVGLAVGVGVTVVAAIGPARGAVRIPPVAALDDRRSGPGTSMRRRFIWGAALALVGAVLLGIGLAHPAIQLVGIGAVAIFIGTATLAPAIARPLSGVIGRPLARLLGEPGKLGRENSMRSPRRTAQTASALMVGLALVAAISVFGASLSRSATSSADQAISADLIVTATGTGELSDSAAAVASAVPGVTATTTFYNGQFEFDGTLSKLTAVSTGHLADAVILRMTSGTPAALAAGELLIDSTTAQDKHLAVGDTVPARFARPARPGCGSAGSIRPTR